MRKGTSLAAAALSLSLATTFITPASAAPAQGTNSSNSVAVVDANGSSDMSQQDACIATGLAMGLPLLLLIPAALGSQLQIPGMDMVAKFNTDMQQKMGIFNPELAVQLDAMGGAGKVAGGIGAAVVTALGIAGAVYLANNCSADGSSVSGSSVGGSITDGSSTTGTTTPASSTTATTAPGSATTTTKAPTTTASFGDVNLQVGVNKTVTLNLQSGMTVTSITGLPAGVTWDGTKFSGIPTTAGTFTATVNGTFNGGNYSAPMVFHVAPAAPATTTPAAPVTTTTTPVATETVPASTTAAPATTTPAAPVTTTPAPTDPTVTFGTIKMKAGAQNTVTMQLQPGMTITTVADMPVGVSWDAAKGAFVGIPATAGTYTGTVTGTYNGAQYTSPITFEVAPADAPAAPTVTFGAVNLQVGVDKTYTLSIPTNWTITDVTNLPAGVTWDAAKNALVGAPTTAGSYTGTVTGTVDGVAFTAPLNITVAPAA